MPVEKAQQLQALLKESRKENVASKADRLTSDALCKQLREKLEAAQLASAAEQDGLQANACCYCPKKQRLQIAHDAQTIQHRLCCRPVLKFTPPCIVGSTSDYIRVCDMCQSDTECM